MELLNAQQTNPENLLADYGAPAEVQTEPEKETATNSDTGSQTVQTQNESSGTNWQGNPLYYQSGKKQGQLKPSAGARMKVSYKKDTEPAYVDGDLLDGALFLTLVDLLFPMIIAGIHNMLTKEKKGKIDPEDLMLTEKQKNKLAPVADRVTAQLKLSANPTTVLVLSMFGLYGMQYALCRMKAKLK